MQPMQVTQDILDLVSLNLLGLLKHLELSVNLVVAVAHGH